MNVAVAVVTLHLLDTQSLKGKRGLLRSLLGRLRQRFNLSIAEVADHDSHRSAVLGLCCVGSGSARPADQVAAAIRFIEEESRGAAEVVESRTELLTGFTG